jgi:hypothetical protein
MLKTQSARLFLAAMATLAMFDQDRPDSGLEEIIRRITSVYNSADH